MNRERIRAHLMMAAEILQRMNETPEGKASVQAGAAHRAVKQALDEINEPYRAQLGRAITKEN